MKINNRFTPLVTDKNKIIKDAIIEKPKNIPNAKS